MVDPVKIVILYNGPFGQTVTGNLINYSRFCISCGEGCTQCKAGKYGMSENILAIIEMPDPNTLDDFIDDPGPHLPKEIPSADIAIVINVHPDIIFGLIPKLKELNFKGLIGGSEKPQELPLGLRSQIENEAANIGLEATFTKPFCAMEPHPSKPYISAFLEEAKFGRPLLDIVVQKGRTDTIVAANVIRSAPCGSTWFVAKRLIGMETIDQGELRERISEAHHAYPCTASMDRDAELDDTILHKAGYIIREAVEDALKNARRSEGRTFWYEDERISGNHIL